jgi:hypothetical protein
VTTVVDSTGGLSHVGRATTRTFDAVVLWLLRAVVASRDPRSRAAIAAGAKELTSEGDADGVQRDVRPARVTDGASLHRGLSMAFVAHDDVRLSAARFSFERRQTACGSPRPFRDESDVLERQMRFNRSEAFVHTTPLECVRRCTLRSART